MTPLCVLLPWSEGEKYEGTTVLYFFSAQFLIGREAAAGIELQSYLIGQLITFILPPVYFSAQQGCVIEFK